MAASRITRSTRFQVGSTLLTNFTNLGLGLATGVLTARALGPADRGVLLALVVWVGTVNSFALLGLDEAIVYHSRGQQGKALELRRRLSVNALKQAALGGVLLLLIGLWVCLRSAPDQWPAALLVSFLVPLNSFTMLALATLRVGEHFTRWNAVRLLPQAVYAGALLALFVIGGVSIGTAVASLAVGVLVTAVTAWRVHTRVTSGMVCEPGDVESTKRYGRRLFAAMIPAQLNWRLDQMILGVALAPAFLGVYAVAVSMSAVLQALGTAVEQVIFPRLSGGTMRRGRVLRLTLLTGSVVAAGAILIGPMARPLIVFLYGEDYGNAAGPLRVLAFGAVMFTMTSVLSADAKSFGRVRLLFWAHMAGMAVTFVALPLLALKYGLAGAAVASLMSYSTTTLVLLMGHLRNRNPSDASSSTFPRGIARGGVSA